MPFFKGYKHTEEAKRKISLAHKGKTNWHKGRPLSEEHKRKIGEGNKGKTKGRISPMKGKCHTEETKMKIRKANKGRVGWMLGKHHTEEAKEKNRQAHLIIYEGKNHPMYGRKHTKESLEKMSKAHKKSAPKGKEHYCWKGGITPLYEAIRKLWESKQWREAVYKRDNYTCQDCGDNKGGNLHAHHIKEFAVILAEFLKEYDQFSPYEDQHTLLRLATKYEPFWDVDNGETHCEKCHIEIHKHKYYFMKHKGVQI